MADQKTCKSTFTINSIKIEDADADACQQHCEDDDSCYGWRYIPNSSDSPPCSNLKNDGKNSVIITSCIPPVNKTCPATNLTWETTGEAIDLGPGETCQAACENDSTCYSWAIHNAECKTFTMTEFSDTVAPDGFASGICGPSLSE
jgi:hypothetical protein